jgi:hypothetical protein
MLIDYTYFFHDCEIGQLDQQPVQDKLNLFIQKYEPEVLEGLLGYQTYRDFLAGLAQGTVDQKWLDLLNGAEYTDAYGKLKKWRGLLRLVATPTITVINGVVSINSGTGIKISLIAYYVYYWYQRAILTNSGATGESKMSTENAGPANASFKMATAWNKMVVINMEMYNFLYVNRANYPDWFLWSNFKYYPQWNYGGFERNTPYKFLTTINNFGF